MEYYFFPIDPDLPGYFVRDEVEEYRSTHPLPPPQPTLDKAIIPNMPNLRDLEAVLSMLPDDRKDVTQKYLRQEMEKHMATARAFFPTFDQDNEASEPFYFLVLTEPWEGYEPGAIVGLRMGEAVGAIGVFPGWTLDLSSGKLHYTKPTPPEQAEAGSSNIIGLIHPMGVAPGLPDRINSEEQWNGLPHVVKTSYGRFERPIQNPEEANPISLQVANSIFELVVYVGQGIAFTNPLAGLAISFVASQAQQQFNNRLGEAGAITTQIANMLAANNVTLERDLALAPIRTHADWANDHYDPKWIDEVMSKKDTDDAKKNKLLDFIKGMKKDLNSRNANILTAINLMVEDSPTANSDLRKPSTAMLKASGFFYGANYFLARGREALNAQYNLEPAKSLDFAELLLAKSKTYAERARALLEAVEEQCTKRVNLVKITRENGRVVLEDDYLWYGKAYIFSSRYILFTTYIDDNCGRVSKDQSFEFVVNLFNTYRAFQYKNYRKKLCSWFWGTGEKGTFDETVSAMEASYGSIQGLVNELKKGV
jgi:hypothetical protein